MKKTHTILIPDMLPIHFGFISEILRRHGYKTALLRNSSRNVVNEGLEYVHNDACYPALLVIGQFIDALKSGKYDPDKTALLISQTGGGCRASNYIHLIRKALKHCGMEQVPVISLNLAGLEKNPGFKLDAPMLRDLITAICYGDLLMLISNQVRPYELNKGDTDSRLDYWIAELDRQNFSLARFDKVSADIVKDFENIPVDLKRDITRVGVVGEIYIKYSPLGNNDLNAFLESEGCEVYSPGLIDFLIFMSDHHIVETELYHVRYKKYIAASVVKGFFKNMQNKIIAAVKESRFFGPSPFEVEKKMVEPFISPANKMGEGWLLTAEMLDMIELGINNIVCAQPFGCLPNHIIGKGMIRKVRQTYPQANIVPIDYDPGATKVNQENRIKLMLAAARQGEVRSEK